MVITEERDLSLSRQGSVASSSAVSERAGAAGAGAAGAGAGAGAERGVDVGRVGSWSTDFEKLLADPVGLQTFTVSEDARSPPTLGDDLGYSSCSKGTF